MGLKSFWAAKPKKRSGTPKSDSLNLSISDSENSYKMEMLEVNNETSGNGDPQLRSELGGDHAATEEPQFAERPKSAEQPQLVEQPQPAEEPAPVHMSAEEMEPSRDEPDEPDSADEIADASEMRRLPQEPRRVMPAISATRSLDTPAPRPRRSRATTVSTTPQPEDSYESQERKQREEAMIRLWRRATTPKKLPFPSRYPGYLKEPPELAYEETHASIRRRGYNDARIKEYSQPPFRRDDSRVKHVTPRSNRAVQLRAKFIRREPLVSQYFSDHYNEHKKPPFKHTNVKYFMGA